MKPRNMVLCGWGPYKNKVEIDFSVYEKQGIFLITGATGAGKTTLFDAISYALYGCLSGEVRDKERSSVRSDFADGDTKTYVELTMEHAGKLYKICRNPEYLRPKKRGKGENSFTREKENAILYLPDQTIVEGVREVNARLLDLLVLDYHQFKQISMIAQGEFSRLLTASPREKTRIFRELFATGVYERFAVQLGRRSQKAYVEVMEQKNKLEENVHALSVDLHKSLWKEEYREQLTGLVREGNWNYDEIRNCLQKMEAEALEQRDLLKKVYDRLEVKTGKAAERLARLQEENQRIEEYQQAAREYKKLMEGKKEYEQIEKQYDRAQNAGWVEVSEEKEGQAVLLQKKVKDEMKELQNEKKNLQEELKLLRLIVKRREKIEDLLATVKLGREKEKEARKLTAQVTKQQKEFQEGQKKYLKEEEILRNKKEEVETIEREQRLKAIGIAASLLREGEPCPVCGSTEHPKPAVCEIRAVSEEELEEKREELKWKEEQISKLHAKVVTIRTVLEQLMKNLEGLEKEKERLNSKISKVQDEICLSFLDRDYDTAMQDLKAASERAGQIVGLLQEKENRREQLLLQEKELNQEKAEAGEAFIVTLKLHGFKNRQDYQKAKLTKAVREQLSGEIQAYKQKAAASQELYRHLKQSTKNKQMVDLAQIRENLDASREEKNKVLKALKTWEQHLSEVRKTIRLMRERSAIMEEAAAEYGIVKDLENLACGKNSRKLVFEQYVLAGYFEEILRAANLRFRKMTSGRYEMSRVEQVGDGRVKDNMEIQVMDYYTGKCRSIRTLSGGESFKASLSLALGMSDVVQAMSGGIKVDTLFIDEGFGALDAESLDQACDALMSLVEKKRLIGVISHVPELREKIDNQLVVMKSVSGSTIMAGAS